MVNGISIMKRVPARDVWKIWDYLFQQDGQYFVGAFVGGLLQSIARADIVDGAVFESVIVVRGWRALPVHERTDRR